MLQKFIQKKITKAIMAFIASGGIFEIGNHLLDALPAVIATLPADLAPHVSGLIAAVLGMVAYLKKSPSEGTK